jgi:hypothetical protein
LCGLGGVLLNGLAGRCDAALIERREDRARADGVHANAFRRVVGGRSDPRSKEFYIQADQLVAVRRSPGSE